MIDMHIHTTASDGTDTPEKIIEKCRKLNLELCSICDHDTVASQYTAVREVKKTKLQYLTGLELSVKHEGEIHLLGYGVDIENDALKAEMEVLRRSREARIGRIIEKLGENNIRITFEDVAEVAHGETMGRPHVALALLGKGYVQDMQEAFEKYLGERGTCYVQRKKLTAEQAVATVKEAGGCPVIAHPKFIRTQNFEKLLKTLKEIGVEGIEAYYPAHTDAEVDYYVGLAKKYGLLVTEGSDYHGAVKPHTALASERRDGEMLRECVNFFRTKYVNRL
ncbi:MAG: PHP domain-containing protein [Christensenellaceae bacterium]